MFAKHSSDENWCLFEFTSPIVLLSEFSVYRNVKSHISQHVFKSNIWC